MIKTVLILHYAFVALALLFLVTQVLLPALRGRPLFPFFRKRNRLIDAHLSEARETADLREKLDAAADAKASPDLEELLRCRQDDLPSLVPPNKRKTRQTK